MKSMLAVLNLKKCEEKRKKKELNIHFNNSPEEEKILYEKISKRESCLSLIIFACPVENTRFINI